METTVFTAEKTKRGLPSLWECGGGMSSSGFCHIITGKNFEMLNPVFVRTGGQLSNANHALFVVDVDYHLIEVSRKRDEYSIKIYRVALIAETEGKFNIGAVKINEFSQGEWETEPPQESRCAIEAGIDKSNDYHCRIVYYALHMENKNIV